MPEHLLLKWGTLKGWWCESDQALSALRKYSSLGMSAGAMQQRDTAEQKQALCELIDAIDGPITNDWTGEEMTKEQAKAYVLEYGLPKSSDALLAARVKP